MILAHGVIVDDDFKLDRAISVNGRGYAQFWKDGTNHLLHRYIMDAKKGEIVDHINRNRLDNRRENLRIVTAQQNSANQRSKPSFSKHKKTNPWRAKFSRKGINYEVGYFATYEEADKALQKAIKELEE